ncbi:MAG TPA: polyphenol oxidase family protein [bacterium]|jgi:YfiH family protein|nr:polyphenol oxidase family protein [bacterium]
MSAPLLLPLPSAAPGLRGFCSTRQGGGSTGPYASLNLGSNTDDAPASVLRNRRLALEAAGLAPERCVFLQQSHGPGLAEASDSQAGQGLEAWEDGLPDCDAVFTRSRGLGLAIGQADCLAVVIVDPVAGLLGLAHAGWRGALSGLPGHLAQRLLKEGAKPEDLRAVLSPCLGPRRLELGEAQLDAFKERYLRYREFSSALKQGKFFLDLWTCARMQLEQAGMQALHIQGLEMDTAELPELFFSHRRDLGVTGRMLTVAWLE